MKKNAVKNITKTNVHFKQPVGLHIIAIMTFCVCTSIVPFVTLLTEYGHIDFFYNRNDQIFVLFFAGVFGCLSNYLLGSTKSIIHGLQFIILAIILSFINNLSFFSSAVLWAGIAITIVNLLLSLSSFYLKTDLRRLYGFIGIYSSAILGIAAGILIYYMLLTNIYHFKIFYLLLIVSLLMFFMKNNYKLNTSLTGRTERFEISFYGVFVIYLIFALILFYLLSHTTLFSLINVIMLPVSLVILHTITVYSNKENGLELLKYVYFSLALIVLNKFIYLSFLLYEDTINPVYINSATSTFLFLILAYLLCVAIYVGWRFKFITLKIEAITNSSLIKTMLYIEIIRIFILIISVFTANYLISNILFILATILGLILNVFIVPIYFSLGKILAGGKNELFITSLLYLTFSSLVFVSFLYNVCLSNFTCNF
ncbi:MAG: hypothetical protein ACI8TE_000795 [Francisella sp.]|jgi:hypothetical protein